MTNSGIKSSQRIEMIDIIIHATDTVSGAKYNGTFQVPKSASDKSFLYGEEVVNFIFESKVKASLGHKCRILLQRGKTNEEIQVVLDKWIPSVKTMGKITEKKIKAETDPVKRKEMIERKVKEYQSLEDL